MRSHTAPTPPFEQDHARGAQLSRVVGRRGKLQGDDENALDEALWCARAAVQLF